MIWLLIGYMCLFVHRPFEVWPSLGEMRLERVYVLATLPVWLLTSGKGWMPNRLHFAFFAFAGVLLLSWTASPWGDACLLTVENYFKLLVFYVLLVTVIRDEQN